MKQKIDLSLNQAALKLNSGMFSEAETLYQKILQTEPTLVVANHNLGVAQHNLGKLEEAELNFRNTIKLKPNHAVAHYNLGAILMKLGRIEETIKSYKKAIILNPNLVEAYNNLASILQEQGELSDAEKNIRKAITLNPNFLEAHNNLGLILEDQGKLKESEITFKKILTIKPNFEETLINLGNILCKLGKVDEAEVNYRKAIELKPNSAVAYNNLSNLLVNLGKFDEAEAGLKKAIQLKPDYDEAFKNLANLLLKLERFEDAIENYKKVLELKPNSAEAEHLLAALIGEKKSSVPREYVKKLFDDYSSRFEDALVLKLEYRIPKIISDKIINKKSKKSLGSILDLGCGTGLVGNEIKGSFTYLEGIDLSQPMLEQARKKNIYNKLVQRDILEYLSKENLNFDYFISADVFVYIGDLSEIFRLIRSRNKSGGKLIFSTEHSEKNDYQLEKSGRYSHPKKYIDELCKKYNYKIAHFEIIKLRKSQDSYITGGLYFLDF